MNSIKNTTKKTFNNLKIISWFFDNKKYVPIANNPNLKYVIEGFNEYIAYSELNDEIHIDK